MAQKFEVMIYVDVDKLSDLLVALDGKYPKMIVRPMTSIEPKKKKNEESNSDSWKNHKTIVAALSALQTGPCSMKDFTEAFIEHGLKPSGIPATTSALKKNGVAYQLGDGIWELTPAGFDLVKTIEK